MNAPIFTIAVLKSKEGRLQDLKHALERLAGETRKEAGAVQYMFVHDEAHDPNTILSFEQWSSAEAEAAHWHTPHLKQAIAEMQDILDGDPVIHRGPQVI